MLASSAPWPASVCHARAQPHKAGGSAAVTFSPSTDVDQVVDQGGPKPPPELVELVELRIERRRSPIAADMTPSSESPGVGGCDL